MHKKIFDENEKPLSLIKHKRYLGEMEQEDKEEILKYLICNM